MNWHSLRSLEGQIPSQCHIGQKSSANRHNSGESDD
jgi:hypothetical protein